MSTSMLLAPPVRIWVTISVGVIWTSSTWDHREVFLKLCNNLLSCVLTISFKGTGGATLVTNLRCGSSTETYGCSGSREHGIDVFVV